MPTIEAGTCIFLEKPSRYSISHLWLVITEPSGEPPEVIIVNLTTFREGADTTVILNKGDHSYIKHETVVYYADARNVPLQLLERIAALDPNRIYDESCSEDLLVRIREGLLTSTFTPRKIKKKYRERFQS